MSLLLLMLISLLCVSRCADERVLQQGRDTYVRRHPLLSSILFVSGPKDSARGGGRVGSGAPPRLQSELGPTLILDQTATDRSMGRCGWLVRPVVGRWVVFRGDLLHGVIPGQYSGGDNVEQHVQPVGGNNNAASGTEWDDEWRITLVVAWWGGNASVQHAKQEGRNGQLHAFMTAPWAGDARSSSGHGSQQSHLAWPDAFSAGAGVAPSHLQPSVPHLTPVQPAVVDPVWVPVVYTGTDAAGERRQEVQLPVAFPPLRFFLRHENEISGAYVDSDRES
jgi:hypothetical protein